MRVVALAAATVLLTAGSSLRAQTFTDEWGSRGFESEESTQGVALGVFALIVGLILFFIRLRGVSLDAFFDRFAPG